MVGPPALIANCPSCGKAHIVTVSHPGYETARGVALDHARVADIYCGCLDSDKEVRQIMARTGRKIAPVKRLVFA